MHARELQPGGWWDSSVLDRLVNAQRRRILAVLLDRSAAVGEQELAARLVAAERGTSLNDVTEDEVETARIELQHSHLPALSDADLVVWDRSGATAETTDHPALEDPRFRYVVDKLEESWDEVMAHLVVERRRVALMVLEAHDGGMSKSTLAREVALREDASEPSADEVDETLLAMHHVHLPKLREAGLVEYDTDAETVAYRGHPELEENWFGVRPSDSRRAGPQGRTR